MRSDVRSRHPTIAAAHEDRSRPATAVSQDRQGYEEPRTMKITYDPLLAEAVVLQEIVRRQDLGDPAPFREYHVVADRLYHRRPDAREAAFQKLHAQFFARLGFGESLQAEFQLFPEIEAQVPEILVALAASSAEEGADLSPSQANGGGHAITRVGIRLQADRFLDPATLRRYLRHEFLHVVDLLNPEFGYEGGTVETIIRNRYRLLWCLCIDARLEAAGREPLTDKQTYRLQFDAQYRKFAPTVRQAIFERLWRPEPLTHAFLLQMAIGSEGLLRLAGDADAQGSESSRRALLPGSLCPLCQLPSYHFVDDPSSLDPTLTAEIQQDFPGWSVDDGLCERCLEAYILQAGRW